MPTCDKNQKKYYSTRAGILQKFREEEKQSCSCYTEVWAGKENRITCINCIRKRNLSEELKKKGLWTDLKALKYWKVRIQGQYKELKIAPVYPNRDEVKIRDTNLIGEVF